MFFYYRSFCRLSLLLLVLMVTACLNQPTLLHPQLTALDKGISSQEVDSRLKIVPISTHSATANNRSFEFKKYFLSNGIQRDIYLLAYEKNQLIFWGYVTEFRRQSDTDLNAALSTVLSSIKTSEN